MSRERNDHSRGGVDVLNGNQPLPPRTAVFLAIFYLSPDE